VSPGLRRELYAARELLELRLLTAALAAVVTALRFEHPTLDVLADPDDPHTLVAARHVVVAVRGLRAALRAYRAAIRRPTAAPLYDDVPF
jgi:hypothetical protein